MASSIPDEREPVRRLLSGLVRGNDVSAPAARISDLHLRHKTFPGEAFLRVGADALDLAAAGPVHSGGTTNRALDDPLSVPLDVWRQIVGGNGFGWFD